MGRPGRPVGRQARRLIWFSGLSLAVVAVVAVLAVVFRPLPHPPVAPASRARPAPHPAATWQVAGPVADLSAPLAGMPSVADPANIYADAGPNMLSAAVRGVPYRIYVPNSGGSTVRAQGDTRRDREERPA